MDFSIYSVVSNRVHVIGKRRKRAGHTCKDVNMRLSEGRRSFSYVCIPCMKHMQDTYPSSSTRWTVYYIPHRRSKAEDGTDG